MIEKGSQKSTGVLLIHGLTGMPAEMRPLEKYFRRAGFAVEAPMLPGHGGTHVELLNARWQQWLECVQDSLDTLLKRVDRVIVVGLSMGGTLGGVLASRNKAVCGLVMLSSTMYYDGSNLNGRPCLGIFLSPLARRLMHYACLTMPFLGKTVYWEETPPYGLKDVRLQRQITRAIELAKQGDSCQYGLFRTYFGSLLEMNLLTEEFLRNVSAITCPTLLIHSYEDTIASASNSTDVYTMLACQDKRMAMLSGCDHVMTLDLRRNHLSRVIGQFADSIGCSVPKDLLAPAESGLHAYVQNVGGTLESRSRHSLTLKHNQKELVSTQFSVVSPKPLIQRSLAKLLAATLALPLDDRKLVVDVDEELLLKRQGEHEMTWPMVSDLLSRMAKSNRSKGVRFAGKLESTSQRLTAFDC